LIVFGTNIPEITDNWPSNDLLTANLTQRLLQSAQ